MSFMAYGSCVACRRMLAFNPHHVPSITVNGEREPVCRDCFEKWRQIHNRPDVQLHPLAYEPTDELGDDE